MKILFYSYKDFEDKYLKDAFLDDYEIVTTPESLSFQTAGMAEGFDVVCVFAGDAAPAQVIDELHKSGIKYIAIRAAGYDNVDIARAYELGIRVARVPGYSPYAIAEHALALILALNRHIVEADKQVHNQDFTVGNLIGFDLHGKTIGIIGTGKIGSTLIRILQGFGCRLIAYDLFENKELSARYSVEYVSLLKLCKESDIISIHTCLNPQTKNLINKGLIEQMKPGVMLINTSRGPCVNTEDVITYLESGHIGYFGADVYEKENGVFFHNWSGRVLADDKLKKLLSMPRVLLTPHQAFATKEALGNIASITRYNIDCWLHGLDSGNELNLKITTAKLCENAGHPNVMS